MKVTVAICTWNRSKLLDQTLAQMHKLRIPEGVEWELLVVNNNCTDDTDAVLIRHTESLPLLRLFEPKQGHSNARNCAAAAAQGELILWTDDDVLVEPDWLECYVRVAAEYPGASFFGGIVEPWFAVPPPGWIMRNIAVLRDVYALRHYGVSSRSFADDEYPVGANMAMRREVLKCCLFNPHLGRIGSDITGGDELQFLKALEQKGHQGVWVPRAKVRHYIPADHLTRKYVRDWQRGCGRTFIRQHPDACSPRLFGLPRWMLRHYLQFTVLAFLLTPFGGRYWLKAFLAASHSHGMLKESWLNRRGGADRVTSSSAVDSVLEPQMDTRG